MLTLFTNITTDLTDLEKDKMVPMLLDTLSFTHEKNRITGKNLSRWFNASGHNVSEVRIRKMVNYIRVMNLARPKVLIDAGNGYFLTSDIIIVDDQIESIDGRINSMLAVKDSLLAQRENIKKG